MLITSALSSSLTNVTSAAGDNIAGCSGSTGGTGAGAAAVAHDVMRAGAKKGCIKRGGKWVGGKCQIAKKTRTQASGPDPRFAKSRGKK